MNAALAIIAVIAVSALVTAHQTRRKTDALEQFLITDLHDDIDAFGHEHDDHPSTWPHRLDDDESQ